MLEEGKLYAGTAIGIVATGPPSWEFFRSIVDARYVMNALVVEGAERDGVYAAHNRLVEWFLCTDSLTLLILASDVILPQGAISHLASWGEPVVSALIPQAKPPYAPMLSEDNLIDQKDVLDPLAEKLWNLIHRRSQAWSKRENQGLSQNIDVLNRPFIDLSDKAPLWPVESGSTHCLLVERQVFEAIDSPWFDGFYAKAIDAGYSCYLDTSTIVGHEIKHIAALCDGAVWSMAQQGGNHA